MSASSNSGEASEFDPSVAEKTPSDSTNENVRLSPGFQIRLRSLEDRSLNGSYRIGFGGELTLPYHIQIQAGGMTLEELKKEVQRSYRSFFKSSVQVGVELADRSCFIDVRGIIQKPGKTLIKSDASIDEVIAAAGGFQKDAGVRYVKIVRGSSVRSLNLEQYYKTGTPVAGPRWQGGETVFFQQESVPGSDAIGADTETSTPLTLLGEVRTPGGITFRKNEDVYFYLAQAGGPTVAADLDKVEIVRGPKENRQTLVFSLSDPEGIPKLRAGDMLIVHPTRESTLQKTVGTAASLATILATIVLIVVAL